MLKSYVHLHIFKHHDFMTKRRCHYIHPYLYLHIETEAITVKDIFIIIFFWNQRLHQRQTNFFSLESTSLLLIYSIEK